MTRIVILILFLAMPLVSFSQNACSDFYRDESFSRPPSTSPKGMPGYVLTRENLKREGYLFDWYLGEIENKELSQALDEYKGYSHRRMNELLRAENPDFTKFTKTKIAELMKENLERRAKDPNFDPKSVAFHGLRLLRLASIIELEVFPLGHILSPGIILYRAVALKEHQIPKEGTVFKDHAFMSTSVVSASHNFSGDAVGWKNINDYLKVEFIITNRAFRGKVLAGKFSESEIILPRNVPLKIISVKRNGSMVTINADLVDN